MALSFCFSITDPPSHGQRQGISLTLSLNTEGVQSFYSWKYFHTLSKCANKTKCLMPLFSCVAKCAFHNLLTQPVLKKGLSGKHQFELLYILVSVPLRVRGIKVGPLLLIFIFSWKKNLMKSGLLLYCFYMFQYFYHLVLVSGLQMLFKNQFLFARLERLWVDILVKNISSILIYFYRAAGQTPIF